MCGWSNQGFVCGIFNFPNLAVYYSAVIFTLLADNVAWPIDCTLTYLLTYLPYWRSLRWAPELKVAECFSLYSGKMKLYELHKRPQYY